MDKAISIIAKFLDNGIASAQALLECVNEVEKRKSRNDFVRLKHECLLRQKEGKDPEIDIGIRNLANSCFHDCQKFDNILKQFHSEYPLCVNESAKLELLRNMAYGIKKIYFDTEEKIIWTRLCFQTATKCAGILSGETLLNYEEAILRGETNSIFRLCILICEQLPNDVLDKDYLVGRSAHLCKAYGDELYQISEAVFEDHYRRTGITDLELTTAEQSVLDQFMLLFRAPNMVAHSKHFAIAQEFLQYLYDRFVMLKPKSSGIF